MRALVLVFTFLIALPSFADEMSAAERRARRKALNNIRVVKPDATNLGCQKYVEHVTKLQSLITNAEHTSGSDTSKLSVLEKDLAALRAESVLINGLKAINGKYKEFLGEVSGLKGWNIQGFDDSKNFSLSKLKEDLQSMDQHLQNAKTMHIMDALLKEAINDPGRLLGINESSADNAQMVADTQKNGNLQLNKRTSGAQTFNQLKDSCTNGQNSAKLCDIIKKADETGLQKIKATVEGFVEAYRVSGLVIRKNARTESRLKKYQEVLLNGISEEQLKGIDVDGLANVNKDFLEQVDSLSHEDNKTKFTALENDINKYKVCIASNSIGAPTSDCSLKTETVEALKGKWQKLGAAQEVVLKSLGGPIGNLQKSLDSAYGHSEAKTKLEGIGKILENSTQEANISGLQNTLEEGAKKHEKALKDWTKGIFKQINGGQNNAALMAGMLADGKVEDSIKTFINSDQATPEYKQVDIDSTNADMAGMLTKVLSKVCSTDPDRQAGITAGQCGGAKAAELQVGDLFKKNADGDLELNGERIKAFLSHVDSKDFGDAIDALQKEIDDKIKSKEVRIKSIRGKSSHKTLEALLSFYGDKVQYHCPSSDKNAASWKCVKDSSGSGQEVYALINETGEILGRLPQSPQRIQITQLNNMCNSDFINTFESAKTDLDDMCKDIQKNNEKYLSQFLPTERDKIYPYVHRYWDGQEWKTEKRQRKRWIFAQSVAEGGMKFLPWELNRRMQMTQVDLWEQSTIDSIEARNNYLTNYYENGPFYPWPTIYPNIPGGYYGGLGPTFTSGFTGIGAGGYFPMSTPTGTSVASNSAGFDFTTTTI